VASAEYSDEQLLTATRRDSSAFGIFYARHERIVFAYFHRRTRDVELAADLTAETFAAALYASRRFTPGPEPAIAWLFGIARNVLSRSLERNRVEHRARKRMRMNPIVIEDGTVDALERLYAGDVLAGALEALPTDQAEAVRARIVQELAYDEIAAGLQTSEAVVRKRVSRGLAQLRETLEER
jgi:RNA polymerase sigma-70 factor (ECF subfamily)